jgi:hypothetical protein
MEGDTTVLEAGTGDSPNPWSDDDDEININKQWTEDIIIHIYKKRVVIADTTVTSFIKNFIQHFSVKVNSMRTRNNWHRQRGFGSNRSTTDHILWIRGYYGQNESTLNLFLSYVADILQEDISFS